MSDEQGAERIWKALEDADKCMLVTRDGEHLRARPMAIYARPDARAIYFLTDARTHKDNEIKAHPQVCVTLDEEAFYCSVSGTATISREREIIDDIWDMAAKAWFKGKDDPNLRLLTVRLELGEYWDRPGVFAATFKTTFAALTGTRPNMGDNEQVEM